MTARRQAQTVKFLTRAEIRSVLVVARARSARDHALVLLAYRHGLRASEACAMRLEDLDLETGQILCRRRKGSITNWQRLAPDEVEAVQHWLAERGPCKSPWLFPNACGAPVRRQHFHRILQRLALEAGIPRDKAHPHALKHSIGTHLANAGVPLQVIQQRLGHRCIGSTMVYLSIASEYVDRTVSTAIEAGAVV